MGKIIVMSMIAVFFLAQSSFAQSADDQAKAYYAAQTAARAAYIAAHLDEIKAKDQAAKAYYADQLAKRQAYIAAHPQEMKDRDAAARAKYAKEASDRAARRQEGGVNTFTPPTAQATEPAAPPTDNAPAADTTPSVTPSATASKT